MQNTSKNITRKSVKKRLTVVSDVYLMKNVEKKQLSYMQRLINAMNGHNVIEDTIRNTVKSQRMTIASD